ncbi:hypothetical protein [Aliihoeflea sp. PC F10.4]
MADIANKNLSDVSDGLRELRSRFADFESSGVMLEGQAVRTMCAQMRELQKKARLIEMEISRRRWNERQDDSDKHAAQDLMTAISRPGSNVHLFPVIARPFSDGRQPGGAA